MGTEEKFTTLDINLAAFLEVRGLAVDLAFLKGRVVFAFPADDQLYKLMKDFNTNAEIKITDYVATLRKLKGKMLSMKNSNNPGENIESLSQRLTGSLKEKRPEK